MKRTRTLLLSAAMLSIFSTNTEAQSTARVRMIASANCTFENNAFKTGDTTRFIYSGLRDDGATNGIAKHDTLTSWVLNPATGIFRPARMELQTFDSRSNLLSTIHQQYDTAAVAWSNNDKIEHTYDANNNKTGDTYFAWDGVANTWVNQVRYQYVYNSANMLTSFSWQGWDDVTGAWENVSNSLFYYNTLKQDSVNILQLWNSMTNSWTNSGRSIKSYDSRGNMNAQQQDIWNFITGSWEQNVSNVFVYDNADHLLKESSFEWNGLSWDTSFVKVRHYNSTFDTMTVKYDAWSSLGLRTKISNDRSCFNNRKQLVSQTTTSWQAASATYKDLLLNTYAYNSQDRPITITTQKANTSGSWVNDHQMRFYYEQYGATGIVNQRSNDELRVYPVPAQNFITVTFPAPKEVVTITLSDVQGKVLGQWAEDGNNKVSRQLSVMDYPSGSYWITVKGKQTYLLRTISVVH